MNAASLRRPVCEDGREVHPASRTSRCEAGPLYLRSTAATMVILPSAESFLTRGTHSRRLSDAVCRYSRTYTSVPAIATPVGDHGLVVRSTGVTAPPLVILSTAAQPEAATNTVPSGVTSRPRRFG